MRYLLVLAILLTGCQPPHNPPSRERPTVNLPLALRQENWVGAKGEGSCVHATMVSLFRWQGRQRTAEHWRSTYGDGEWADASWNSSSNLVAKFEREGVRYAYVVNGDVSFLEWACRTRRGAGVTVKGGRHMVALVHLDDYHAGILDNNDVQKINWVSRSRFISEWQNSRGWAVTPVYTPPPPLTIQR